MTLDDMFKAVEINRRIKEATEREEGKKSGVKHHVGARPHSPLESNI